MTLPGFLTSLMVAMGWKLAQQWHDLQAMWTTVMKRQCSQAEAEWYLRHYTRVWDKINKAK
jgi:hypothetical protein